MTENPAVQPEPRPPGAPIFPHFKPLELADREAIEAFTRQFDPYSDFCFSTLIFYDGDGHTRWCWLNGNLALHLHDGFGPGAYLTFLGGAEAAATAAALSGYAERIDISPVLRRVPEISALAIAKESDTFSIEEDRDGFDYSDSTQSLTELRGSPLITLRYDVNFAKRHYAHCRIVPLDLCDPSTHARLRSAVSAWHMEKNSSDTLRRYCVAFESCLLHSQSFDLGGTGVMIGDVLAGFSIMETTRNHWLLSHFKGTAPQYAHLSGYLLHQAAARGFASGQTNLNFQEDLGNPGLRRFKMKCAPSGFLRKYFISLKP